MSPPIKRCWMPRAEWRKMERGRGGERAGGGRAREREREGEGAYSDDAWMAVPAADDAP